MTRSKNVNDSNEMNVKNVRILIAYQDWHYDISPIGNNT